MAMSSGSSFSADAVRQALAHVEGWQGLAESAVVASVVSGGLTNVLTCVRVRESAGATLSPGAPAAVLVRHFGRGTHSLINRKREAVIFAHFGSVGLSPALLGTFDGGRIEQFFDAKTLVSADCHVPATARAIGFHLGRVHGEDVPIDRSNGLPALLTSWWKLAVRTVMPTVRATRKALQFDFAALFAELTELLDLVAASNSPLTFVHMDLLAGNILELREPGREGEITFVDFEYGMYAPRGFDFGNHFAEAGITYDVDGFPGFCLNPDNYPDADTQTAFFTGYLAAAGVTDPADVAAAIPDLIAEARLFTLVSHMQWGLWSVVRAANPSPSFGFLEFAAARFDQYFALRDRWAI